MHKRIILSGGTYAGKTTLINELKSKGFTVIPEAALIVMNQLNEKLGVEKQKEWKRNNYNKFQDMIIKKQVEMESNITNPKDGLVFYDRCIDDIIGFHIFWNRKISKNILDYSKKYKYNKVFICDTLKSFDERKDTGRVLDKKDSLKIRDITFEIYSKKCEDTILLEEKPTKERIEFILSHI